jgi:riboflavin kinase/FMN adenylyltransferase
VYAAWARGDLGSFRAAVHIGPNATFGAERATVEAHLLDLTADLYGRRLELDVVSRVRGTQKFAGVDELLEQIGRDVAVVRESIGVDA